MENIKSFWSTYSRDIVWGCFAGMVAAILCFLLSGCSVAYCLTESGNVSGSYQLDTSSIDYLYPDGNAINGSSTGTFSHSGVAVLDGVSYEFTSIAFSTVQMRIATSDGNVVLATTDGWNYSSVLITFDSPWVLGDGLSDNVMRSVLSAADWLSAPEPFPDSIGSSVTSLVSWLGDGLTAIISGSLSSLLPLIGIGVAVSVLLVAWLFIKRSTWGT